MSDALFKRIPVEELLLDSNNPRLPKSMTSKTEREIINYLLSDASLIELMLAIGKNGFFEGEQLLVVLEDAKYLVVEGNRRLSAVKLLLHPELGDVYKSKIAQAIDESQYKPTEIPCLVFETKHEILKYLGYRHVTGIKSWKLLEKARYLTRLKNDYFQHENIDVASREIAKMIGSRKDYVVRVLAGYKLYEIIERNGFYAIKDLDDTTFYFNYLADSLSRTNISNFLGIDFDKGNPADHVNFENLREWANWLFNKDLPNKIIGDSENINNLNRVISHPAALQSFRNGEKLVTALEFTDAFEIQFKFAIENAIKQMEKADMITVKIDKFYERLDEDLNEIYQRIKKIKSAKELKNEEF